MKSIMSASLVIMLLTVSYASQAREFDPKLQGTWICRETGSKAFYGNMKIDNVKPNGEPTVVEIDVRELRTRFESLTTVNKYKMSSGFVEDDKRLGKLIHLQYFDPDPYGWGTRTLSFIVSVDTGDGWMIDVEPMIESDGVAFLRTYFHFCQSKL